MTDLRTTIIPKSDQMNSDDLIGGPVTIKVANVSLLKEAEQPIAINYEGDGGKPYKPCKSMRRVMVTAWGPDGNAYKGRSMTLYRDASVLWGGQQVGGIRISHMSDIKEPMTMALTATKQSRKPFTVRPLVVENVAPKGRTAAEFLSALETDLRDCGNKEAVKNRLAQDDVVRAKEHLKNASLLKFDALILEHRERVGLTLDDPDHPAEMNT